jgi:uncharacterized protein (UPF0276 family)
MASRSPDRRREPIPAVAGIGLRDAHYRVIDEQRPAIGWLEVHSENFFGNDRRRHAMLTRLREDYPLSLHGVGLSLGSVDPLDREHLAQLKRLVERYEPWIVSEHASWSSVDGQFANTLLPLPRTEEALAVLCAHIAQVQDTLQRPLAIENIAAYLEFGDAPMGEPEFLREVVRRTGCHLLLDVNNLYVNAVNHDFNPVAYLDQLPAAAIVEYHLAGHEDRGHTLIDTHGRPVAEAVWMLYAQTLARLGPRPTLVEWDVDLPDLGVLLGEMRRADAALAGMGHAAYE